MQSRSFLVTDCRHVQKFLVEIVTRDTDECWGIGEVVWRDQWRGGHGTRCCGRDIKQTTHRVCETAIVRTTTVFGDPHSFVDRTEHCTVCFPHNLFVNYMVTLTLKWEFAVRALNCCFFLYKCIFCHRRGETYVLVLRRNWCKEYRTYVLIKYMSGRQSFIYVCYS